MGLRTKADPATEAWQLVTVLWLEERPLRMPAIAAEFDLSPMAVKMFYGMDPNAEVPMSALAEQVGCDASNVTGIVDRLEARGLIERRDAPRDRRVKLIALTDEGARVRERVLERLYEPPAAIAALPRAEQRTLRDLLRRAVEAQER